MFGILNFIYSPLRGGGFFAFFGIISFIFFLFGLLILAGEYYQGHFSGVPITTGLFLILYFLCVFFSRLKKKRRYRKEKLRASSAITARKPPLKSESASTVNKTRPRRQTKQDAELEARRRARLARRRRDEKRRKMQPKDVDGKEQESIDVDVSVEVEDFYFAEGDFNRERFCIKVLMTNNTGREIGYIEGVVRIYGPGNDLLKTIGLLHENILQDGETVEIDGSANLVYGAQHELDLATMDIDELDFGWETRDVKYVDFST